MIYQWVVMTYLYDMVQGQTLLPSLVGHMPHWHTIFSLALAGVSIADWQDRTDRLYLHFLYMVCISIAYHTLLWNQPIHVQAPACLFAGLS